MKLASFPIFKQFSEDLNFVGSSNVDPVLHLLFGIDPKLYLYGQIGIFCLGVICLNFILEEKKSFHRVVGLISYFLALYAVFGRTASLCSVQWFPWVLSSYCYLVAKQEGLLSYFLFLITSLLWIYTSGPLAFGGLLIIGFFSFRDGLERFKYLFGLLLIFALLLLPESYVPYYPGDARLIPGQASVIRPQALIGPRLDLVSVNFSNYQGQLQYVAVFVSIIALASLLCFVLGWLRNKLILLSLLGLSAAACLEYYLLEVGAINTLYLFISRIVPGLGLFPFVWGVLLLILIPLFAFLFFKQGDKAISLMAGFSCILFLVRVGFVNQELEPLDYSFAPSSNHKDDVYWSPSRSIVEREGAWVAEENAFKQRFVGNLKRVSLPETGLWIAKASENSEKAMLGLWDPQTSWGSGVPMIPGQWFEVRWENPVELVKVLLALPSLEKREAFENSYPRGFKVEGIDSNGETFLLREIPQWNGPVRWTKESFPYYGNLHDVIVDFPEIAEVQGLRFTQTGTEPSISWSISEVKLYGKSEG